MKSSDAYDRFWIDNDIWNDVYIRKENVARAAKAIVDAGLCDMPQGSSNHAIISHALYSNGYDPAGVQFGDGDSKRDPIRPVLKAIARFVDPGDEIVGMDFGRPVVRYVFRGDTVECWTRPVTTYTEKEVI